MDTKQFYKQIAYISGKFKEQLHEYSSVECLFADYLVDFEDDLKSEYRLNLTGAVSAAAIFYQIVELLSRDHKAQDVYAELANQFSPILQPLLRNFVDIAGVIYGAENKVVAWDNCVVCGAELAKYLGRCEKCGTAFSEFAEVKADYLRKLIDLLERSKDPDKAPEYDILKKEYNALKAKPLAHAPEAKELLSNIESELSQNKREYDAYIQNLENILLRTQEKVRLSERKSYNTSLFIDYMFSGLRYANTPKAKELLGILRIWAKKHPL